MQRSSKKRPKRLALTLWKLWHIHGIGKFAVGRQGIIYCTKCHTTHRIKYKETN